MITTCMYKIVIFFFLEMADNVLVKKELWLVAYHYLHLVLRLEMCKLCVTPLPYA